MNNSQVAHLWANQSRQSAKGSSFYFEGSTIYSYGPHFPIARHYQGAVLMTTRGYSNTTAKHKSLTYRACHHLPVFHVLDPLKDPNQTDVTRYAQTIDAEVLRLSRARTYTDLAHLERLIEAANAFCVRFGFIDRFSVPPVETFVKAKRRSLELSKAKRAANAEKTKRLAEERAQAIKDWLAGDSRSLSYQIEKVYLRTSKDGLSMETSKGATVPLQDAKRAFQFVIRHKETGWHRNGETFAIGDFHLDSVNDHGVIAGCHRVSWDEIERFATANNWNA